MKLETWSNTREPTQFLIKRGENSTFFKTRLWKSVFSKIESQMISKPEIKKEKKNVFYIFDLFFKYGTSPSSILPSILEHPVYSFLVGLTRSTVHRSTKFATRSNVATVLVRNGSSFRGTGSSSWNRALNTFGTPIEVVGYRERQGRRKRATRRNVGRGCWTFYERLARAHDGIVRIGSLARKRSFGGILSRNVSAWKSNSIPFAWSLLLLSRIHHGTAFKFTDRPKLSTRDPASIKLRPHRANQRPTTFSRLLLLHVPNGR